jgi:hypothetical protein
VNTVGGMMETKLWEDLYDIVSSWVLDHPQLFLDDLTDDIFDYIIEMYAPPF